MRLIAAKSLLNIWVGVKAREKKSDSEVKSVNTDMSSASTSLCKLNGHGESFLSFDRSDDHP